MWHIDTTGIRLLDCATTGTHGPVQSRRRLPLEPDRAATRVDGQNRVADQRRCPLAEPRRLNDENSRPNIKSVRGVSSDGFFNSHSTINSRFE